jgi:hypothetical protein
VDGHDLGRGVGPDQPVVLRAQVEDGDLDAGELIVHVDRQRREGPERQHLGADRRHRCPDLLHQRVRGVRAGHEVADGRRGEAEPEEASADQPSERVQQRVERAAEEGRREHQPGEPARPLRGEPDRERAGERLREEHVAAVRGQGGPREREELIVAERLVGGEGDEPGRYPARAGGQERPIQPAAPIEARQEDGWDGPRGGGPSVAGGGAQSLTAGQAREARPRVPRSRGGAPTALPAGRGGTPRGTGPTHFASRQGR